MNIRIKGGLVLLQVLFVFSSYAQNDYFFNHYMFNPSYYNPAWVGVEDQAFASLHHRSQWLGYSTSFDGTGGAPSTQLLSLVLPIKGQFSGVGLSVSNDRVATLNTIQAKFSFSAKKDFRFGQVSVGLMPTVISRTLDPNFRAVENPDPLIPTSRESQIRPTLNAGVYFQSRKEYFVGASVENILKAGFDFGTQAENATEITYLLLAGTSLGLSRDLIVRPTTLVRTDLNSYSFELSAVFTYQETMWGGLSFRRSEAISLLLGYSFLENKQLKFGYSFDYVIQDREAKQPTSHEIYVRYDLPDLVLGGRKAIKTPRFNY